MRVLPVAALTLGLSACGGDKRSYPGVGESFPLTALKQAKSIAGPESGIEGKTLLINFWATWCAPCRREMPELQRLSELLDNGRYAVIGITVDEDLNLAREFLLRHRIRFANLHDEGRDLATRQLGVEAFPQTYVVAPDGLILKRITGERSWTLRDFDALMGEAEFYDSDSQPALIAG